MTKLYIKRLFEFVKKNWLWIFVIFFTGFLIFKFILLFSSPGFLPGWDTFPHYYTLQRTVELFSSFQLFGYDIYWLGGFPILYFYGPFLFWIGALFHIVSGIPLILIWRILLFVILLSVIYAFWLVSYVLWGKKFSFFGIVAGIYFFFFEYHYGALGIGWRSVLSAGLISSYLGLTLNLIFFALSVRFLKAFGKNQQKHALFLIPLLFATIILNSILGTIFAIITACSLLLYLAFIKKWNALTRLLQMIVLGVLISGFFLFPFFKHLSLTSGGAAASISQLLLPTLLPFLTYSYESLTNSVVYFFLAAFLFLIFFLKNIFQKTYSLFLFIPFFAFLAFIISGEFFAFLLPTLPLHYYRAFPYLLSFFLLLSLEGMYIAKNEKQKRRFFNIFMYLCILFVLIRAIAVPISFERNNLNNRIPFFNLFSTNKPYEFSFTREQEKKYNTLISKLLSHNPQRAFVESYTSGESADNKKTELYPHELTTILPLKANIPVINGLYIESSYQNPFIQYVVGNISKTITWGFDFLSTFPSEKKSFNEQLSRLGLFGVNTIIAHSETFKAELEHSPLVTKLFSFENYDVYHLNNFRPLIFHETKPVGLYLDFSKNRMDNFRILSSSFFLDKNLFDYPIAFDYKESAHLLSLQNFDYFVFLSDEIPRLKKENIFDVLINSGKPLFVLRSKNSIVHENNLSKNIVVIDLTSRDFMKEVPNTIFSFIKTYDRRNNTYINPSNIHIDNHVVSFLAEIENTNSLGRQFKSAWIINLSYFPNWIRNNNEEIFLVNSGQMLTFAKLNNNSTQEIIMTFERSKEERIGFFVSAFGVLFFLLLYLFYKKE